MADLGPIPLNPSPNSGELYPDQIRPAPISGKDLIDILEGTDTLPSTSIPVLAPLTNDDGAVELNIGSGLTVAGGQLTLNLASVPTQDHADTHSPDGSDPIDPSSFDGLIAPPIATTTTLGGVIVGDGLSVDLDGEVSLSISDGLTISGGDLSLSLGVGLGLSGSDLALLPATSSDIGGVYVTSSNPIGLSPSGGLYIKGVNLGDGFETGNLVLDTAGSPRLMLSEDFVYDKPIPADQLPVGSSSDLGVLSVGPSLSVSTGVLNLPTTISPSRLPLANNSSGLGVVALDGNTGLSITGGLIGVKRDGSSLSVSSAGLRVAQNQFVELIGNTASPGVSGTVRFTNNTVPAIALFGRRIAQNGDPATWVSPGLNDHLARREVEDIVAAASFGLTTKWHEPVQVLPNGVFPQSLTTGHFYLTSIDSVTEAPGVWNGNRCVFAKWTGSTFTYESPTVSTLFTVASSNELWYLEVDSPAASPVRSARPVRFDFGDRASASNAGLASVPENGGLVVNGGQISLRVDTIGAATGLGLAPYGSTASILKIALPSENTALGFTQRGELRVLDGGITTSRLANKSVSYEKLAADNIVDGTKDFIQTTYDGLSIRLRGDSTDFRIGGVPVSDATTPLIHTESGIGIAVGGINTDAITPEGVTFSRLLLSTTSGIGQVDAGDAITIKLAPDSGLQLSALGLSTNIHNPGGSGTIEVDQSTGGLRVRLGSLTSEVFASGFGVPASSIPISAPLVVSDNQVTLALASPLNVSSGELSIAAGGLSPSLFGSQVVGFSALNLASPSFIESGPSNTVALKSGPELVVTAAGVEVVNLPANKLDLDPDGGLYSNGGSLAVNVGDTLSVIDEYLEVADRGVSLQQLDVALAPRVLGGSPLVNISGFTYTDLSDGDAAYMPSPFPFSPDTTVPGVMVATRTRRRFDYLGAGGQGKGTIEPFGLHLLHTGATLPSTPDDSQYSEITLTPNAVGLRQLALGNLSLQSGNSERLPSGLGSYKQLIQDGLVSASPVTSRGWAVDDLSNDIIAINVGVGLTISNAGKLQTNNIPRNSLAMLPSPVINSGVITTPHPIAQVTQSGLQRIGFRHDMGWFSSDADSGLTLNPIQQIEFTGSDIPAITNSYYVFNVDDSGLSRIISGSVQVIINGLVLDKVYYRYDDDNEEGNVSINATVSPTSTTVKNLTYTLSGLGTYPDTVQIRFRTRPVNN